MVAIVGLLLTLSTPGTRPVLPHDEYERTVHALAERFPNKLRVEEIGRSAGGRSILALRVPAKSASGARQIYLVAGLEGDQPAGSRIALAATRVLVRELDLPPDVELCIIPRANPDGMESWSSQPLAPRRGNDAPVDEDRDWQTDEDPPNDLDGDGRILRMRVRDPDGTLIPDPAEPRLLRRADRKKGEVGRYLEFSEGIDDDGDGQINEDARGGASPSRNFPHAFQEHQDESGRHPLSTPAARSIVDDLLAHPRAVLLIALTGFDNVTREPETEEAPSGFGRAPQTKMQPGDAPTHKLLAQTLREILELKANKKKVQYPGGDLTGYCYFQLGIPALSHPFWLAPSGITTTDRKPHDEPTKDPKETPDVHESPKEDARWLAYADAHPELEGFLPWRTVSHPRFGEVEVGGFVPGFREIPPPEVSERLGEATAEYLRRAAKLIPRVVITRFTADEKGGGVFWVEVVVENTGQMPLVLEQAITNRHVRRSWVHLELEEGSFLSANGHSPLERLAPGEQKRFEWWISSRRGTQVTVRVETTLGGESARTLRLGVRREEF